MSKLDDILDEDLSNRLAELSSSPTRPHIYENKQRIKLLMLEIFGEALSESATIGAVGDKYRKMVSEL